MRCRQTASEHGTAEIGLYVAVAEIYHCEQAVACEGCAVFFSERRPVVAVEADFVFVEAHRRVGTIVHGDALEFRI